MCLKFNCWNGWSIFKRYRLASLSLLFLLRATVSVYAQTVTNVDFVVISGLQDKPGSGGVSDESIWNRYPSGRMLFWTVLFDENQNRGTIYRSESGHIGFMQIIDGTEYFLIADETGSPCRWMLESHPINVSQTYMGETRSFSTYVPSVWAKTYFDVFGISGNAGRGSLYKNGEGVIQTSTYVGVVLSDSIGNCSFKWRKYSMGNNDYYGVVAGIWGEAPSFGQWEPWWYQGSSDYYSLHAVWRANYFDVELEFFRSLLDSKWWITGKYSVHWSHGINGIGHGTGEQGGSGAPAPSGGGSISVPGDILNPPTTPLGDNGRWVYDPEKGLWQWQGDIADNVNQINPYDNSVMPENSGTIEGKWATESTLRRVLQTIEGFQKEQGITTEQLQAMLDAGVVSIVDGMIQFWEGKHIPQAIASVGDRVDQAAQSVNNSVGSASGNVSASVTAAGDKVYNMVRSLRAETISQSTSLRTAVHFQGDRIVDAINNIEAPSIDIDVPSTDGQTIDNYDAPEGDVGSLGNELFDLNMSWGLPVVDIPVVREFPDWDVGVFDWVIPLSYFSYSKNPRISNILHGVREFLSWLCWLTLVVGCVRSIGGD